MNPLPVKTWELKQETTSTDLLTVLAVAFTAEPSAGTSSTMTFFDDFDAHLWRANYLLCRALLCGTDEQQFQLIDQAGNTEEASAIDHAKFWWDFSAGSVQNTLQDLIGVRALMPVASVHLLEQNIALRNYDQKLVVKASLQSHVTDKQTIHYFTLKALRGYTKEFTTATNLIAPLVNNEIEAFSLRYLLTEQTPAIFEQEQTSLPSLTADMPTEQAVRAMAIAMLQQASVHVPGVIADTDTEFLHQFRVYFRKLRSLVSLLHKALPAETVALLKPTLSTIAGATNKLRDLDVFLLEQDTYRAMLPDNFSTGLGELYEFIQEQREQEKTAVAHYFSSDAYANDLARCAMELASPASLQTPVSAKPLLRVVNKLLLTRYHKMLTMSAAIHSKTLDEEVHELRIEFKKLRYLIEFFISLLPPKRMGKFIGDVKKIQAVLGNFNDYGIQIEFLSSYVDDSRIDMSKALSGLIAVLHQKKMAERKKVDAALANFFTPVTTNEVEFLFGAKTSGVSE